MEKLITFFIQGLRAKWTFVGSVVLLLFCGVGLELGISRGWYVKLPLEHLLTRGSDQFTYLNYLRAFLDQYPPSSAMFFLGGSAMREALWEDSQLSADLKKATGEDFNPFNFGSVRQSFAVSSALEENLPSGWRVVGVNLRRFTVSKRQMMSQLETPKFWIRPRFSTTFAQEQGISWNPPYFYFASLLNYFHFWLRYNKSTFTDFKLPHHTLVRHFYDDKPHLANKPAFLKKVSKKYKKGFDENFSMQLQFVDQWIGQMKLKGHRVLFVELPTHPLFRQMRLNEHQVYQQALAQILNRHGVPYGLKDIHQLLGDEDFYDHCHLLGRGREIYQNQMVQFIKEQLPPRVARRDAPTSFPFQGR